MQDIRKPYIRSRSNSDLSSRVEQFENRSYNEASDSYESDSRSRYQDGNSVMIPARRERRDIHRMSPYPNGNRSEQYSEEEIFEEERRSHNQPSSYRDPRARVVRHEKHLSTWVFIIVILVLAIASGLMTYVFNSATVTIIPKYKDIDDLSKTITFSQKGTEIDSVPYVIANTSLRKSKALTLSESKKVESKATGKITIYNNYDASTLKLIKNTRFESAKGKIYRINQSVDVPGKKGNTPGSVEVVVYADSNGADYNIDSATFKIPAFKGTARYDGFYAKTITAVSGGSSGNVSLASLSDLNAAKDELALELSQEIKVELQKIKKEGYVGLYSASEITFNDNEADVLNGKTGTYEVTATGNILFANAAKFAETLAKDIRDYNGEPVRVDNIDSITYTRKDADHIASGGSYAIMTEGKPRIIWATDFDAIRELVKGKRRDEFKPLMKQIGSIEGAEIGFSPLWLSSFPDSINKIKVIESLPKR